MDSICPLILNNQNTEGCDLVSCNLRSGLWLLGENQYSGQVHLSVFHRNTALPVKRKRQEWKTRKKTELPPSKVLCLVYFLSTPAYARLLRKCFWSTWQQSSSICHSVFSVKVASLIIPFSEGEAGSFGQHVLRGEAHSPSQTGQTACSPNCRVQRRLILFKEKTFGCSQNPRTPESNFPRLKARRSGHRRYFRLGGQPYTVAAAGKPPQAQH